MRVVAVSSWIPREISPNQVTPAVGLRRRRLPPERSAAPDGNALGDPWCRLHVAGVPLRAAIVVAPTRAHAGRKLAGLGRPAAVQLHREPLRGLRAPGGHGVAGPEAKGQGWQPMLALLGVAEWGLDVAHAIDGLVPAKVRVPEAVHVRRQRADTLCQGVGANRPRQGLQVQEALLGQQRLQREKVREADERLAWLSRRKPVRRGVVENVEPQRERVAAGLRAPGHVDGELARAVVLDVS
mmetsp:Transcript_9432/g.23895  ORF Transcript_9432/g.23895 Transcript_9432/m.23895 type:complete len:240 (+) Transcript_9432:247-966(+)